MSASGKVPVWMPALLVLAGALAYANSLSVPFLFDGVHAIAEDRSIRSAWPPWEAMVGSISACRSAFRRSMVPASSRSMRRL